MTPNNERCDREDAEQDADEYRPMYDLPFDYEPDFNATTERGNTLEHVQGEIWLAQQ